MSKISAMDLTVCIDALIGAASIKDGGTLFKFTNDYRRAVANKLITALDCMAVQIEPQEEEPEREAAERDPA